MAIFWKLRSFKGAPHFGHLMNEAFWASACASASCLDLSLATSSRSFLTKYSSSFAFFRSSHLLAIREPPAQPEWILFRYARVWRSHLLVLVTDLPAASRF